MAIQQADELRIRQHMKQDKERRNQQREAGTKIITEAISKMSKEFNRPDIKNFSFESNHDHWYILDVNRRAVMKVSEEKLTDIPSPSTPELRRGFEAGLRAFVIAHHNLSIPN